MQYQIVFQPSYALLIVGLDAGERVRAEAGALVSLSSSISVEPSPDSGDSLVVKDLVAAEAGSDVSLAPVLPGDIGAIDLRPGQDLFVQSGAYLASADGIEVDTAFGEGRRFFSAPGTFLMRLHGAGTAFVGSYGALRQVDLVAGQEFAVDTDHVVAFDSGVGYDVPRGDANWQGAAGGLVVKLTGPGRLWLQTRSPAALAKRSR
jgi:uncharacterized protein (TIGR00266 family)